MKISGKKLFSNSSEGTGITLFLLLTAAPLLLGIGYALLYSLGIIGLVSEGPGFGYWREVLADGEVWGSIAFSLYIALVTIAITIAAALGLTLFLRRPLRRGFPGFSLYLPLAFPAIVVAFLVLQLASQSGLLARIAFQLGWIAAPASFPELVNDPWGIGIIAAHSFMAVPFFTLYFITIFDRERVNRSSGVAQTLGATRLQRLRQVEAPILLKKATPTLLLYSIFVIGSYEIPLILGRQSPQMVSVLIIRKLRRFSLSTIPEAYVIALLVIGVIVLGLTIFFKLNNFRYDLNR